MKYFFSLLLLITLSASFSYGADQPKDTAETAQETPLGRGTTGKQNPTTEGAAAIPRPPPAKETTDRERLPLLEETTRPASANGSRESLASAQPEEQTSDYFTHLPNSWDGTVTLPLEETSLGRAVIEGDIQAYKMALIELNKGFTVELKHILRMKTTDGKSLMDLMISTEINRDFFTREMMRLLMITSGANTPNLLAIIDSLLKTAQQVNNNKAFESLMAFQGLIAEFESDQINMKNFIVDLLNKPRHRFKVLSGITYTAVGTLVTVLGYKVLTSTLIISNNLPTFIASIPPVVTNNIDTVVGAGSTAAGVSLGLIGINHCRRAFKQSLKIKRLREQARQNESLAINN